MRKDRREKKCPNNPHPHLLQAQQAFALLSSKVVGRPGSESLPRTFAPPDHPQERKRGRQKKRWKDNIKEWTGMDFASSTRAAENRIGWEGIVANSSVVPRRPSNVME